MKKAPRKRFALATIVAASVLVGGAWFGDLSSAVPVDVHENGGGEPLLQPPSVAVALVERALQPYGGVPHDAQLTGFAFEQATAISPGGGTAPAMVVGFDPTYEPRDALLWKDHILTRVEAVTQQTCLDGGTLPLRYDHVPPPPLMRPAPSWASIVATVRARAETEMHWRAAGHRAPESGRIVSVDRHPGAESTVVVETSEPSEGRRRARFTVDERVPAIRLAEFARTGG